jgi:hypothetical protein
MTAERPAAEALAAASDAFHALTGIRVRWASKQVAADATWEGMEPEDEEMHAAAFKTYEQVKRRFESAMFKIRKPISYMEVCACPDGSKELYMRTERELVACYRNEYYYNIGVLTEMRPPEPPKKRARTTKEDNF